MTSLEKIDLARQSLKVDVTKVGLIKVCEEVFKNLDTFTYEGIQIVLDHDVQYILFICHQSLEN